jgi:tetratricopeptide (TPR) repeat protein
MRDFFSFKNVRHTMRLQLTLLLATCWFAHLAAQTPDELNALTHRLSKENKYTELTALSTQADRMGDSSLYRLGRAFFYLDNYPEGQKYLTLALQKNPRYANAWYYRGVSYLFTEEYDRGISDAKKGRSCAPEDPDMPILIADCFFRKAAYDSAMVYYQAARRMPDCSTRAWSVISTIYFIKDDLESSVSVLEELLDVTKTRRDTLAQSDCLSELGIRYQYQKQSKKAEGYFEQAIALKSDNYEAVEGIIQAFYAQKKYKKADPYRQQLYAAWQRKDLPKDLQEEFQFDKFDWKDYHIVVVERFEEDKSSLYYKHIFKVFDADYDLLFTIQTESSAAITMSGNQYTIGRTTATKHYTYIQFLFKKDFDYDDVKKAVIRILEGKEEPSSSSNLRKH